MFFTSDYNWFTSTLLVLKAFMASSRSNFQLTLFSITMGAFDLLQFSKWLQSVNIRWDSKGVSSWIFWTDVPVVPDSFRPYFHQCKRAQGKQCILIESCSTQKRLRSQRKIYKGKPKTATENCQSSSYTATNKRC